MTDVDLKAAATREPNALHEAFAKFIKKGARREVAVEDIAAVLRLYPHFRNTDEYEATRAKMSGARDAAKEAAHARGQARIAERAAKLQAKVAELQAKLEGSPEVAPVVRKAATKAVAKKAAAKPVARKAAAPKAEAAPETKDAEVEEIRAPRGRRGRPAAAAPVDFDDDPF